MGGCGGRTVTKEDQLILDCEQIVNRIKLNTVNWKKFSSEVGLYGAIGELKTEQIKRIMEAIGLGKEFSNENSILVQFLKSLHLYDNCNASDLIVAGLLFCKGLEIERGEYLCYALCQDKNTEKLPDASERMKGIMAIAIRTLPELVINNISGCEAKFINEFKNMDEGILSASTKRWLPSGDFEDDKIVYKKSDLIKWVQNGEFSPIKAIEIALKAYDIMHDVSVINLEKEEIKKEEIQITEKIETQ